MEQEENDSPSSLYFLSTQIQSLHEESERTDQALGKLSKFKNKSPSNKKKIDMRINKPRQSAKMKKKSLKAKPTKANSRSLSAFVKQMFQGERKPDRQSILEYFAGDVSKVDEFLESVENATESRLELRKLVALPFIHSQEEWEALLKSIRLKFPDLPMKNQKTLKKISQQLETLRNNSDLSPNLQSIWSQASRQPSENLTAEDVKWLYDLDDVDVVAANDSTVLDTSDDVKEDTPFYLTLSQAMNDDRELSLNEESTQSEKIVDVVRPQSPIVISDSESEPEAYVPTQDAEEISSHQVAGPPESVDVLTSIAFKSKRNETNLGTPTQRNIITEVPFEYDNETTIFSSPVKHVLPKKPKTPTRWPSALVITSSPVSSGKDEVGNDEEELFATAKTDISNSVIGELDTGGYLLENPQTEAVQSSMPLPRKTNQEKRVFKTSTVEYQGDIEILHESVNDIKLRKLTSNDTYDQVPDSEDSEGEVSIIEISKPVISSEEIEQIKNPEVLQVPSSPRPTPQSNSHVELHLLLMKEVKELYTNLKLPPTKLKANMIDAIEYAIELTGTRLDTLLRNPDHEVKSREFGSRFVEMLYDKITNLIKMVDELHLKIALFEPLNVEQIAEHLQEHVEVPIPLDLSFLQGYCDAKGISTTNKRI